VFDVEELRRRADPEQVNLWLAFAELEPFGDARADLRNGLLGAALANSWGADYEPEDFMPFARDDELEPADDDDEPDDAAQAAEELAALNQILRVRQIVARHNAGV
jgi:hypothetical protein